MWQKLFSPFFKVKLIKKKELTPIIKGFSYGLVSIYLLFLILNFVRSTHHDIKFIFGQSLIVSFLLFLALKIEMIKSLLLKPKILSFLKAAATKMTAGAILPLFLLLNMFSIGHKLFNHPSGPNVLLIVPDALRADHLGCYGYNRPTSPMIDKFAANAFVFEKALSNASWTLPSMGSLFTSLYPHEHRAFYWTDSLPDDCLTLAEVFRNKKYKTFAV